MGIVETLFGAGAAAALLGLLFLVLLPLILTIWFVAGIWRIHKSLDAQRAVNVAIANEALRSMDAWLRVERGSTPPSTTPQVAMETAPARPADHAPVAQRPAPARPLRQAPTFSPQRVRAVELAAVGTLTLAVSTWIAGTAVASDVFWPIAGIAGVACAVLGLVRLAIPTSLVK